MRRRRKRLKRLEQSWKSKWSWKSRRSQSWKNRKQQSCRRRRRRKRATLSSGKALRTSEKEDRRSWSTNYSRRWTWSDVSYHYSINSSALRYSWKQRRMKLKGLKANVTLFLCCSRYAWTSRLIFQVLSLLQYSLSASMSTYGMLTTIKDSIQRKHLRVILVHPEFEIPYKGLEQLHLRQGEEFCGMSLHIGGEVEQEESNELREWDVFDEDGEIALKLSQILESQCLHG